MNQGWTYCDRIESFAAGKTVLAYYTERYIHSSQADWQARIVQEQVLLNGQPIQPQTVLRSGDRLSYHRLPWQEAKVPLDFEVVYEDAHLLVVDKPSGLPVLPSGGFVEHTLLHQLKLRYSSDQLVPVHRLGRGTSGAVLIARTSAARAHLSKQFRRRSQVQSEQIQLNQADVCQRQVFGWSDDSRMLKKVYRALVGPTTAEELSDRFICTDSIGKLPHNQIGYVYGYSPGGLFARSDCRVLQRRLSSTLLSVSISTGRPHQIRIHLATAGYPLLGDPLYPPGGVPAIDTAARPGDVGYFLHAHQLGFVHPETKRFMTVTVQPPDRLRVFDSSARCIGD